MLGAPLAFFALMGGLYWFGFGGGRRYLGAAIMLFGAALLAITAIMSFGSDSLGPAGLIAGIVVSASVGFLGYGVRAVGRPDFGRDRRTDPDDASARAGRRAGAVAVLR